jgi:antitoxin component YwqK of YwqJK toxin-antitoxin module
MKEGPQYTWFQSGMLKSVEPYVSGVLDGSAYYYSETGTRLQESIFKNGELIRETFWNSDGDLVYYNHNQKP